MSKVLVVAPHPDDETLGCGGTLLRHVAEGDSVHWLIATAMRTDAGYEVADVARMEVGGRAWESVQAHPRVPCDAEQLAWLRLRHARRQRVNDRLLTHGGATEMCL